MACAWPGPSRHSAGGAPLEGRENRNPADMGKTILVVDGSPTWRKMIQVTLTAAGHEVLEAEDGAQGLELAETEPVDIIFSGCQLPDMDGPNFTRKIRSLPGHKKTPLIAISDSPDDERKEAAKSAGGTGWMVQPVMPEKLIEAAEGFAARIDLLEAKARKKAKLKKKRDEAAAG